jgi:hypothetical protein
MRMEIGFTGLLSQTPSGMYERDERWAHLSWRRKMATIVGQVHYRSVYAVVLLSVVDSTGYALVAGLALLAAYKHVAWIRMITRTLAAARGVQAEPAPVQPAVTVDANVATGVGLR